MPHVVLRTNSPLHELIERVEPFAVREADTVWRLRDVHIDREGSHGLVECLIVARGAATRFFIQLAQREDDGAVVVRPYVVPRIETTPPVKRMVALVAEALVRAHPDVEIAGSTVAGFLSGRYRHAPEPDSPGWDPMLPERGLPRPLDWGVVFGVDHPVEIEIGSGKGTFLVEAARARPGTSFLSIEWAHPYAERVRERMRRHDLRNVRVVRADAARFLADHVPPASVAVLHVYFPDPWPKKRHHKRRLMTGPFAETAVRALAPAGEIRFVTDHAEYFAEASGHLAAEPGLEPAPFPEGLTSLTNYERKYHAEGRPIHRARFLRALR